MKERYDRWLPCKAGFVNFWVYDNEEYSFRDGNILFRGENGQGKSVSMQSIIPLLLDGNTRANRIDPFGTNKRKIIDYLKVDDEVDNSKIAYLYLTYEKEISKEILTTCIGLRAIDMNKVDFWGFVCKGSIGKDVNLLKPMGYNQNGEEEFVPFSKTELKKQLEEKDNTVFVTTQRDYADEVNKALFKYQAGAFKELTDLLIQIRSPKLSKEMKPDTLYNALKNALPELPSSDFSIISNTIKDIDDRNRKIEKTRNDLELAKQLANEFKKYQEIVFSHAAYRFYETSQYKKRQERSFSMKEDDLISKKSTLIKVRDELKDIDIEYESKNNQLSLLESPELKRLYDDKRKNEKDLINKINDLDKKIDQQSANETEINRLKRQLKQYQDDSDTIELAINDEINEIKYMAEDIQFQEHDSYLSAVMDNLEHPRKDKSYFNNWKARLKEHTNKLKKVLNLIDEKSRLEQLVDEKKEELRQNGLKIDQATSQLTRTEKQINDEKTRYKQVFRQWLQENEEYTLHQHKIADIMSIVDNLYDYEDMKPKDVENELFTQKGELLEPIKNEFYENAAIIRNSKEKIVELNQKKKDLENVKEIEPPTIRQQTKDQRRELLENRIPFVPFYEAVEFARDLSEQEKERIESALWDMGVLDRLIVPKSHHNQSLKNDAILLPKPFKNGVKTLKSVLNVVSPDNGVTEGDILSILQSIALNDNESDISLNQNGQYRHGLLKGHALIQPKASFIGKEARKRYRDEQISLVQKDIDEASNYLSELESKEIRLQRRQALVDQEYDKRPSFNNIDNLFDEKRQQKRNLDSLEETQQKLTRTHQELSDGFARKRYEFIQESNFIEGPKDKKSVTKILDLADGEYRDSIDKLSNHFHSFETKSVELNNTRDSLTDLEERNYDVGYEILNLERETKLIANAITNIEHRLETLGSEEIEKESELIRNRLAKLDELNTSKIKEEATLQSDITGLESELTRLEREVAFSREQFEARKEIFENAVRESSVEKVSDLVALAKDNQNEEVDILDANQTFYQSIADVRAVGLEDFSLTSQDSLAGTYQIDVGKYADKKDIIKMIENERKRQKVTLFVQGAKKDPSEFHDYLDDQLNQQESYLEKEEETLIKNVMIQGTGEKIRALTLKAKEWAEDINGYMNQMNNSIKLRLLWNPIEVKKDEALDTKDQNFLSTVELVKLLGRDFDALKTTDIEALSDHFMAKINLAKERLDKKNTKDGVENLEQALKEVLDYRDWYKFQIKYTLEGEKEKTLNEDNLAKLSGGEKAMAIYIPLFSAAFSKYSSAADDAPYLVALDEAFAGVDENNISEMFGIMEYYGFDYILTSQALWGDYPTVTGINIYELNFDKEEKIVFSEPWSWNGNKLTLNESMLNGHGLYLGEDGDYEGEPIQMEFELELNKSETERALANERRG